MEPSKSCSTTHGPQPIHAAIQKVWLFTNIISFSILGVLTSIGEHFFMKSIDFGEWIPIMMPLLWIGIGFLNARYLNRLWHSWKYEVTEKEVILCFGVFTHTKRYVPRDRVQHVDITSGPIARKFGLAHVHLYVAGAHGSVGEIPGVTPEEADELRNMLVETQAEHV